MRRSFEQLATVTQNNRTINENVKNGIKAWTTRRKRMIERALENGVNVSELLGNFIGAHIDYYSDCSKFGILSRELGKISFESFYQFGDRNLVDREIRRNYLSKSGSSLDVVVMELSDRYFIEISTNDAIEFMTQFPNPEDYHYELTEAINEFYEEVGFRIDLKFANEYIQEQSQANQPNNCPF